MNESMGAADEACVTGPEAPEAQQGDEATASRLSSHATSTAQLGRRIRRLRLELGLTLKDLEARGGISATHISEVERGKASPTVGALGRIAHALGVRAAVLVPAQGLPDLQLMRAAERESHTLKSGALQVAPLTGPTHGASLGAHLMSIAAGAGPALTHRHEGEECITVLSGSIEIRVAETVHLLHEGDTLHFRAHIEHSYANAGKTAAVFVAASQPRFFH